MTTLKGRELDAAIETEVFGLEVIYIGSIRKKSLPYFSTDIAAAFQVVEKMREEGWLVSMWYYQAVTGAYPAYWYVSFTRSILDLKTPGSSADTLPEAICLAALEAKGVAPSVKAKV